MRSKICNSGTKILNKNYYTIEHPIAGYERVFDSYISFYVATCEVSSARIFSAIASRKSSQEILYPMKYITIKMMGRISTNLYF